MKNLLLTALAALVLATPVTAFGQAQWFDYNGQTLLPAGIGGDLTLYAKITNNGSIDTPLPLTGVIVDRYTLVISGLTLMADDGINQTYSGGTIQIIEDDATLADFANPATFTDGTVILEGSFDQFVRTAFTPMLVSGSGSLNWTAGTRLDEIAPADRLGWTIVASISSRSTVTEPGYDENWNGKVEPGDPIVSDDVSTWGQLKRNY